MALEIERKFLVKNDNFKMKAVKSKYLRQGYIFSNTDKNLRVRIADKQGFLTIKGKGKISRYEWEKEIPLEEAKELMLLCEDGIIEKTRFFVPVGAHIFEVDEFYGENQGLIVAEIELNSVDESFEKPDWLGEEVTGIQKYYNASLKDFPFSRWK